MAVFTRGRLLARFSFFTMTLAAVLLSAGASVLAAGKKNALPSEQRQSDEHQTARYFTINEELAKLDSQKVNSEAGNRPTQLAALDLSPAATDAATRPQQTEEPFGLVTFRAPEGLLWVKWRKLAAELDAESQVLAQCRRDMEHCANPAARKYLELIAESRRWPDRAKIELINRAINAAVRYTSDQDQYGVPDLWTAPLATLGTGQGDCEDYAIAKYVALRESGFSADDLRIVLVHDRVARQHHAVAGVRQNGRWLMLDNRHEVLLERNDARHFTPLFALDQQGVKLFAAPYGKPSATPPAIASTNPVNTIEPASTAQADTAGADALGLRLDTFEPPALRGRM